MYELVICSRDGPPLKRFDLSSVESRRQRVVIGRAEDCDVRIASPSVSRHHAAIEPDEDEWIIRDLGSTHGVVAGGISVPQAKIRDGLEVIVGAALLKFTASKAAVAEEIARELGD